MDRTLILLDCHPVALAQANCPQEIDLPPCSLWTCLVEGTIEYCRVVLDVCAPEAAVSVQAAGLPPSRSTLNTWDASEQSITQIFNAFGNVSPRSVSPSPTRLPSALETGFGTLAERDLEVVDTEDALPTKKQWNRGRVVLVLWAKARDEDGYSYRETLSDAKTDLRVMIYHALEKARKPRTPEYEPLHHVEVNIIRIYPEIALDENLPEDLPMQEISSHASLSIHNIPNSRTSLPTAMTNLVQKHHQLDIIHITGIPMKKKSDTTRITHDVTLLFPVSETHFIQDRAGRSSSNAITQGRLHYTTLLADRVRHVRWVKRKNVDTDSLPCRCMHPITPVDVMHQPTSVFINQILSGANYFLAPIDDPASIDASPSSSMAIKATHALINHDGVIFLHCLDETLQLGLDAIPNDVLQLMKKRANGEGVSNVKMQEFIDSILTPNILTRLPDSHLGPTFALPEPNRLRTIEPFRFTPTIRSPHMGEAVTTASLACETKWWSCMQVYDDEMAGKGRVVEGGFGSAVGLIADLFEELKQVMVADDIPVGSNHNKLIHLMIDKLATAATTGDGGGLFPKTIERNNVRTMATRLLKSLYLIGKRFRVTSDGHRELCTFILSQVDSLGIVTTADATTQTPPPVDLATTRTQPQSGTEAAWQQVQKFENMTLRERQDYLEQDDVKEMVMDSGGVAGNGTLNRPPQPMIKTEPTSSSIPTAFHQQLLPFLTHAPPPSRPYSGPPRYLRGARAGAAFNPNFRGAPSRSGTLGSTIPANPEETGSKYPDHMVAKPYLHLVHPTHAQLDQERIKEEDRFGDPAALLWQYWMGGRGKRATGELGEIGEGEDMQVAEEDLIPTVVRVEVGRDGRRIMKRVRKEFDGRMPVEDWQQEMELEGEREREKERGGLERDRAERWRGRGRGRRGRERERDAEAM